MWRARGLRSKFSEIPRFLDFADLKSVFFSKKGDVSHERNGKLCGNWWKFGDSWKELDDFAQGTPALTMLCCQKVHDTNFEDL